MVQFCSAQRVLRISMLFACFCAHFWPHRAISAGKQVPEDVVGRELLKEENLGSGKLGDRKTFLP